MPGTGRSNFSNTQNLIACLHQLLQDIHKDPYPPLLNPPGCKKRASVACIIRIRPDTLATPNVQPPGARSDTSATDSIKDHFAKHWVQSGDPEILFIRRAARKGDRWTSQVALPGGKRDPEDEDDRATSIRETFEEVGLDLTSKSFTFVGKLPGRVITTEWGTVPLMVLSPFVYLMTDHTSVTLKLQPTEIASAHWVPLRALMMPSLWTYESAETSDRYAKQGGPIIRYALRALVGQMLFGAIKLAPSESIYSSRASDSLPESSMSRFEKLTSLFFGQPMAKVGIDSPLLLWGLTHGIILDLIRLIPDSDALSSWRWPTFSAPDVRFAVWLVSFRFRRRKLESVRTSEHPYGPFVVIEEGFASQDRSLDTNNPATDPETRCSKPRSRLEGGMPKSRMPETLRPGQHSAVHYMLQGYFRLIQRGIVLSMLIRVGASLGIFVYVIKKMRTSQ